MTPAEANAALAYALKVESRLSAITARRLLRRSGCKDFYKAHELALGTHKNSKILAGIDRHMAQHDANALNKDPVKGRRLRELLSEALGVARDYCPMMERVIVGELGRLDGDDYWRDKTLAKPAAPSASPAHGSAPGAP